MLWRVLREQDTEWGNAKNGEEHRRNAEHKAVSGGAGLIKELWQGASNRHDMRTTLRVQRRWDVEGGRGIHPERITGVGKEHISPSWFCSHLPTELHFLNTSLQREKGICHHSRGPLWLKTYTHSERERLQAHLCARQRRDSGQAYPQLLPPWEASSLHTPSLWIIVSNFQLIDYHGFQYGSDCHTNKNMSC